MAEGSIVPGPPPRRASPGNASHTTTLPSPLPLRNRLLKSKTSFEGTLPVRGLSQRRGSLFSDFSLDDAQQSVWSSTGSLLLPKISEHHEAHDLHQEPSHWHSAPLAFALIPAVVGLFFEEGTAFATDILLLGMAAIFLNWTVRLPWEMYRDAQATKIRTSTEDNSAIVEEGSEDGSHQASASPSRDDRAGNGEEDQARSERLRNDAHMKVSAKEELRLHELVALTCCFLGPILGAYLLHTIRTQLSRPSEGLVSNYSLTIFLLAAELRPAAHLIKLIQARTLHLQRTVNASTIDDKKVGGGQVEELEQRIFEFESHLADLESDRTELEKKSSDTTEVAGAVNKTMQPQLDALNRAVRRYEKRAMTQAVQTEARIQDLEKRLKDALSLAAVAVENGRHSGFALKFLESINALLMLPIHAFCALLLYPVEAAATAGSRAKTFLIGPRPIKKKRSSVMQDDQVFVGGRMGTKGTKR